MAKTLDMVLDAVEEYNNYVKNHDVSKHSFQELRGLFYNCLRRHVHFKVGRRPDLRVDALNCCFHQDGRLESYSIPRTYYRGRYEWECYEPIGDTISEVKSIGERIKKFYDTRILNEMAIIVNSIN